MTIVLKGAELLAVIVLDPTTVVADLGNVVVDRGPRPDRGIAHRLTAEVRHLPPRGILQLVRVRRRCTVADRHHIPRGHPAAGQHQGHGRTRDHRRGGGQ